MAFLKVGENINFSQEDLKPTEAIENDPELNERLRKIAMEYKKISPKADDFVYFTAIMMHAAERAILDDDGNVLKDKKGNDITAKWKIDEKTGSWKWECSDAHVKPYRNANCFVAGTKVLMDDASVKNIEDIKVGDKVITHLGNVKSVTNTSVSDYAGKLISLKIKNGERITCTEEHPFFHVDLEGCKIKGIKGLTENKKRNSRYKPSYKFSQIKDLNIGDLLTTPVLTNTINSDVNPNRARLLGVFAAEGSYMKKYDKLQGVCFTIGIHEETQAKLLKDLFEEEFPECSVTISREPIRSIINVKATGYGIGDYFFYHIGEYCHEKRLSKELVFSSDEVKKEFLAGWIDGDGCKTDYNKLVGISVSPYMSYQIYAMLVSLNIGASLRRKAECKAKAKFGYKVYDCRESYRIEIYGSGYKILDLDKKTVKYTFEDKPFKKFNTFHDDYYLHAITDIEHVDFEGKVYNFEVEDDHSYVVNGIAVHNCDIFPEAELKKAYRKWVGKPLCKDHQSSSVDGMRGLILDTYWDDKYKRIIALCAIDKINYPDLARKVSTGYANSVSMGTAVGKSICFECGNVAKTERDYCHHVKTRTAYGEINTELQPIELSLVVNGADSKAKVLEVLAATQNLQNNIIKSSTKISSEDIKVIREEFAKLANRIDEIEKDIDEDKSVENNFALKSATSNEADLSSDIKEIKMKMSQIEESIKQLAIEKVSKEEFMGDISKKSYFQGTEEPKKYEKEDADKVRLQDKQMIVQDTGPVDGLFPGDLEKKKMLARAAVEERKAIRAEAVEKAQAALKNAYVQGTQEPKPMPVDPGQAAARKVEQSQVTKDLPNDEKTKKLLQRASLKARLIKGATTGENRWDIVSEEGIVLSATFDQLSGKRASFYSQIGTNDFAKQLMRDIRALGLSKTAEVYKLAQEPAMPEAAPAPAAPVPEAAPETLPEVDQLPEAAEEKPQGGEAQLEVVVQNIGDTVDKLQEEEEALKQGLEALQETEVASVENPEAQAEQAVSELESAAPGANVTASLDKLRIVLHAGLQTAFKKTIKKAKKCQSELQLVQSTMASGKSRNPEFLAAIASQSIADAEKVIKKSQVLKASFVKFAYSADMVQKQAALEVALEKQAQAPMATMGAKPAAPAAPAAAAKPEEKKEEEKKEVKPEEKKASMEDLTTVEGRREYRQKLAAAAKEKCSDMLQEAHPKSVKVEGIVGSDVVVENAKEVQDKMMASVQHEPKAQTKQAAKQLNDLILAGRVQASRLDDLVKEGMDKEVVSYWRKYYGQVEGGAEFAAALTKEYSDAKAVAKKAEEMATFKVKIAKAFDLAYEMAEAGLISKSSSAIKDEAEKIVNYDDGAYDSMKRVVAHHASNKLAKKAAVVQVGVNYDSNTAVASEEDTLVNQYIRAFASSKPGAR